MDEIFVGLFANCLWSFGDKLIHEIPRLRQDRRQAEFVLEALEGITGELRGLRHKLDEESVQEHFGKRFLDYFQGSREQLDADLSYFKENMPEIVSNLKEIDGAYRKIQSEHLELRYGQKEMIDILMRIYHSLMKTRINLSISHRAFVARVASIFGMVGYEVQQDITVGGKEIDISATCIIPLNIKQNLYIQCAYDYRVNSEKIHDFINTLYNVPRAAGIMVSHQGFEIDALELAKEHDIVVLDYDELISQIIDFPSYLDRCVEEYGKEGMSQGKTYLDQYVFEYGTRREQPLKYCVQNWLNDDSQNLLVIVDHYRPHQASYRLTYELVEKRKLEERGAIPIRIELGNYHDVSGYEDMVVNCLSEFKESAVGQEFFELLLQTGGILPILDFSDRMHTTEFTERDFGRINKALKGKSKAILMFRNQPCEYIAKQSNCRICSLILPTHEKITEELALKLWISDIDFVRDSEMEHFIEQDSRVHFFFVLDHEGNYRFADNSLMDFFLARRFSREITRNQIVDFGRKEINKGVADSLAYMITNENLLYELLKNKSPEKVGHAGANVISVIRSMKGTNLAGSDFSNCILTHADFGSCSLAGANFSGAYMHDIRFCMCEFSCIDVSPDSRYIVVGSGAGITILSFPELSIVEEIRTGFEVKNVSYSPDGKHIIAGASLLSIGGRVIVLNSSDFSRSEEKKIRNAVEDFAFSPDGKCIAFVGKCDTEAVVGIITVFTLLDSSVVEHEKEYHIFDISFSPDGKYVALVGGIDSDISILDSVEFCTVEQISVKPSLEYFTVHCAAYSPDGRYFIVVGGAMNKCGFAVVLDASDFSRVKEFQTKCEAKSISFSPSGKSVAIAGGNAAADNRGFLSILDLPNLCIVKEIETRCSGSGAKYTSDGRYIMLVGGGLGSVTVLDAEQLQIIKESAKIAEPESIKGIRIDGAKKLDQVLEEALRRETK